MKIIRLCKLIFIYEHDQDRVTKKSEKMQSVLNSQSILKFDNGK